MYELRVISTAVILVIILIIIIITTTIIIIIIIIKSISRMVRPRCIRMVLSISCNGTIRKFIQWSLQVAPSASCGLLSDMGVWALIFSEMAFFNLFKNPSLWPSDETLKRTRNESKSLSKRSKFADAPNRLLNWTRLKMR